MRVAALVLVLAACALNVEAGRALRQQDDAVKRALIVVDVQPCFCPGGSLPVKGGDQVVPIVNTLIANGSWDLVAFTQDYHPAKHVSFASIHGLEPAEVMGLAYTQSGELCNYTADVFDYQTDMVEEVCTEDEVEYTVDQVLWPDHCVQGTEEAELHPGLAYDPDTMFVIQKGNESQIDSYSGMSDLGHFQATDLPTLLESEGITDAYVVGLAFDYCVFYTALDLEADGYRTYVVVDATRGIAYDTVLAAAEDMEEAGIVLTTSGRVLGTDDDPIEEPTAPRNCTSQPCRIIRTLQRELEDDL